MLRMGSAEHRQVARGELYHPGKEFFFFWLSLKIRFSRSTLSLPTLSSYKSLGSTSSTAVPQLTQPVCSSRKVSHTPSPFWWSSSRKSLPRITSESCSTAQLRRLVRSRGRRWRIWCATLMSTVWNQSCRLLWESSASGRTQTTCSLPLRIHRRLQIPDLPLTATSSCRTLMAVIWQKLDKLWPRRGWQNCSGRLAATRPMARNSNESMTATSILPKTKRDSPTWSLRGRSWSATLVSPQCGMSCSSWTTAGNAAAAWDRKSSTAFGLVNFRSRSRSSSLTAPRPSTYSRQLFHFLCCPSTRSWLRRICWRRATWRSAIYRSALVADSWCMSIDLMVFKILFFFGKNTLLQNTQLPSAPLVASTGALTALLSPIGPWTAISTRLGFRNGRSNVILRNLTDFEGKFQFLFLATLLSSFFESSVPAVTPPSKLVIARSRLRAPPAADTSIQRRCVWSLAPTGPMTPNSTEPSSIWKLTYDFSK